MDDVLTYDDFQRAVDALRRSRVPISDIVIRYSGLINMPATQSLTSEEDVEVEEV